MPYYLFFIFFYCCVNLFYPTKGYTQTDQEGEDNFLPIATYDELTMWKNWAFTGCIATAFENNTELIEDARFTLYAYFELGSGLDIYSRIGELTTQYLKGQPYTASKTEGGEIRLIGNTYEIKLMKCIDYYLSDELDQLLTHYQELSAQLNQMMQAIYAHDLVELQKLISEQDLKDSLFIPMTVDLFNVAIEGDFFDVISLLIQLGLDPDAQSQSSESALTSVFYDRQNRTLHLQAMLDGGLSPNHHTPKGTLLYQAASCSLEITKLLIERGANIDTQNNEQKTALDHAIEKEKIDIALYLVEQGSNFSEITAQIIEKKLQKITSDSSQFDDLNTLHNLMLEMGINSSTEKKK